MGANATSYRRRLSTPLAAAKSSAIETADAHSEPVPSGLFSRLLLRATANYRSPRALITVSLEILCLIAASYVFVALSRRPGDLPLEWQEAADQAAIQAALFLGVFYLMDLYNFALLTNRRAWLLNLAQALGVLAVIFGIAKITVHDLPIVPSLIFANLAGVAIFVVIERSLVDKFLGARQPLITLALLAPPGVASEVAEVARKQYADLGLRFHWIGGDLRSGIANIEQVLNGPAEVRRILVEPSFLTQVEAVDFLLQCRRLGVEVEDLEGFLETAFGKAALGPHLIRDLTQSPALCRSRLAGAARRLVDIIIAFVGIILSAPITLLIALAIRLESRGPAFFIQERVGKNGRIFKIIKFRTMYVSPRAVNGFEWTTHAGDPRITRVGHAVRKLHLDEVPQLINVLKGDMNLVGPRPFHRAQVDHLRKYLPYFHLRELVAPGITGWAQIRCDYAASIESQEEVLARDLYYVRHAGLLFDFFILIETIRVVLWRHGSR